MPPFPFRLSQLALAPALALAGAQIAAAQPASPPAPEGCTGPASATWLKVDVEGVNATEGLVAITLYADDSRRFLVKHGSLYVGRTKAEAGVTHGCIFVPQPGTYAIAVYHDANANQIFDRNALGLPEEAYGFSNNPHTFFGLPSFSSVRVKVGESGQTIRVHLHYP